MYTPHTDFEREEMLKTIGVSCMDDLFADIPEEYRYPRINLPEEATELDISSFMTDISLGNDSTQDLICFLGAGAYSHYIPAVVDSILRRGEFYTAYTPYQPEISQGTLQAIFEYQTLMSRLTGMDACNASHYDGATATAEAAILAYHHFRGKKNKILLSNAVNPQYRAVLRTYMQGVENVEICGDEADKNPLKKPDYLLSSIDADTALVVLQYPDFFGRIYDYTKIIEAAHTAGALVAIVINPITLGLLRPPGDFGADIAVGEGQPLGIPLSFGGPYLGIFAVKEPLLRKISGRLVGETVDAAGRRGFVLTLTAREQHIRREKATSNICTNQGLMALASTVYMSVLGKSGLRDVANLCYQKAHYCADNLDTVKGFKVNREAPFFHEFVVKAPRSIRKINEDLLADGILGGYDLGADYPALKNHMLVAVTELVRREHIDALCEVLGEA